jgi:hypothetical protein
MGVKKAGNLFDRGANQEREVLDESQRYDRKESSKDQV